jgi:hypothetical protein
MANIIDVLKKDLKVLDSVIELYQNDLMEADDIIKLKGKQIDFANVEHSGWANYYHQKGVEVKNIRDYVEMKLDEVQGQLWMKYTEHYDRQLAQKDIERYIKQNQEYLDMYEKYLKVNELWGQFERVRESFKTRGYNLNNLTKLITANVQEWEMT